VRYETYVDALDRITLADECDRQTDRQTDRRMSEQKPNALYTDPTAELFFTVKSG